MTRTRTVELTEIEQYALTQATAPAQQWRMQAQSINKQARELELQAAQRVLSIGGHTTTPVEVIRRQGVVCAVVVQDTTVDDGDQTEKDIKSVENN